MQKNPLEKKKYNYNKSSYQLKIIYPFIKGIPPSSNWSNHFTSLLFSEGKYLIYISNSFIIILDLIKKRFSQILSSYKISSKDKPNILISLDKEKFLSILNSGDIVIFELNEESNFIEDLNTYKYEQICKKVKCGLYDKEQKIIIVSNEDKIYGYSFEYEDNCNINKIYEIDNVNEKEYFITDMILIKKNSNSDNNYLAVCNNVGNIIIYKYDNIKCFQMLIINTMKKENIYNIIYNNKNDLLISISKSGTLNIYNLIISQNDNMQYNLIFSLTNKFNDQTINELYLYFSICFINLNYLLITSNQGRIFIYDIKNNSFKEIAENPHKNSIYSILLNNNFNQVFFFSSDYKISLFDLINKKGEPYLNFAMCINTIPSKARIIEQYGNKIYFLYQIQHTLYINSYDVKKDKNTLDTIQNEVKIKNDSNINININNINKEKNHLNYNLDFCKLIDDERFLLINKNNEIMIYNIEKEECENKLLLLNSNNIIIDILYENDILYILYKSGLIIIYNIISKKIEKYKISNIIEKGNLLYIENNQIVISLKEDKTELIKFYIMKNYFFVKLKEIKSPNNEFFSYQYLFSNYNFFYFYSTGFDLQIFYMNLNNQNDILKNTKCNQIKYEEYLERINKLKDSIKYLNEKSYEFNSIFQKSDVNKNNSKMISLMINENFDFICSFSDGSIMYYALGIDTRYKTNYIVNKIIYKYLIKSNFMSISNAIFINYNKSNNIYNNSLIATTSAEQSLKIIDISKCNILNINFEPTPNSNQKSNISKSNNYIINKSFTNIFSNYFFTQPMKEAKKFSENFSLPYDINNSSIEVLIYSYFDNNEENNFSSIKKIIEYANNKNNNKKQNSEYVENICGFFMKQENIKNNLIFEVEKNDDTIINTLIESFCYVEVLLYVKMKNLGLNIFIECLEKIKKSIYLKQFYQVTKIEKIIEYYKNNFNINAK